jgi:membrane protein YqaA with SNARE-associated domain
MSVELLVQTLGGLTGIAVAYAMHRFFERRHERVAEKLKAEHQIAVEEIRQQKERLRKNK